MSRRAAILVAVVLGLIAFGTAPAGAGIPILPKQAIAPCGWLKLERGGLLVFHGYYTTPCRRAAEVLVTFWRSHRRREGAVGQWRCDRRRTTVTCTGPKRQWAQSGWFASNACPHCGHIHLPPGWQIRARQG